MSLLSTLPLNAGFVRENSRSTKDHSVSEQTILPSSFQAYFIHIYASFITCLFANKFNPDLDASLLNDRFKWLQQ